MEFSLAHLSSINNLFYLNGIVYFKGTGFYPCLLIFTVPIIKVFGLGYYKKDFVGFYCNIFTDRVLPEAGSCDEKCLTDHIRHSSLLIILFA